MSRIFISYKRKDKRKVYPIIDEIRSRLGEDCWYDIDGIETQAQFASKICNAIDEAEVVLFMHSKHHLDIDFENDWTIKELNYASAKKKKIILIKLDNTQLENIFLLEYGSKNYVNSFEPEQLDKLYKDLGRWLKIKRNSIHKDVKKQNPPKGFLKWLYPVIPATVIGVIVLISFFKGGPDSDSMPVTEIKTDSNSNGTGFTDGYEWVDLGLSVKWATCNVGATKPEEFGDYYAWGETNSKNSYTWGNYRFCSNVVSNDDVRLSKYNSDSKRGKVDNKTNLDLSDDVANVKWGGNWRMPTEREFRELINNCTWKWTTQNGVNGYLVTGKNGYTDCSIFLPAGGYRNGVSLIFAGSYCHYWSSSLSASFPLIASYSSGYLKTSFYYRNYGLTVRPVCK